MQINLSIEQITARTKKTGGTALPKPPLAAKRVTGRYPFPFFSPAGFSFFLWRITHKICERGWNTPVWFKYEPRRVYCSRCEWVRTEKLPWVTGKQRFTLAYSCYLAKWAEMLPWYSVAKLFSCAWGTVATAVKSVVNYGMEHRDLSGITHIYIDEISRKKSHVYLTNVYDLRSKTLIWSGVERTKDTLRSFFNYLGPERTNKLQGICCDMWKPYVEVIKECAPQATLVFDKFHIVRHLMEAVGNPFSLRMPAWWRSVLIPSSLKDLLTSDSTLRARLSISRWMESENEMSFFTAAPFLCSYCYLAITILLRWELQFHCKR